MVVIMELKKYKNKNRRKPYVLIIIGFLLISISTYLFYQSYALYEENRNFDIINGTVEDPGDIYFAYYVNDKISRELPKPSSGYTLDETKSNCNNNVNISWNHASWEANINYQNYNSTSNTRTKCILYFEKTNYFKSVLGNVTILKNKPDFTKSACDDESCESHEKGIYETTDYDGNPTYYYRGSVENNYVKFAGYYWRIIRINSNGSVRVIYDGTSAHANGESSSDRQLGTSIFNSDATDTAFVGYMYEKGNVHGLSSSSVIKNTVDDFYEKKLKSYASKLDANVGFCGDRTVINNTMSGAGTSTTDTFYSGYARVAGSNPTLMCSNMLDYYTTSNASNGNKALTYPIGLITADEVMLAGHAGGIFDGYYNYQKTSKNNYLTVYGNFWTMTPVSSAKGFKVSTWLALNFSVYPEGKIDDPSVAYADGVKPVINIRSDVTITGSGTMTDPYNIVSE